MPREEFELDEFLGLSEGELAAEGEEVKGRTVLDAWVAVEESEDKGEDEEVDGVDAADGGDDDDDVVEV